jgi:WD40 repeat protein
MSRMPSRRIVLGSAGATALIGLAAAVWRIAHPPPRLASHEPTSTLMPAIPAADAPGPIRSFLGHEDDGMSHHGDVICVAFSFDGLRAASGGEDQTARLWDVGTGKEIRTFVEKPGDEVSHDALVTEVAFSQDGQLLASCAYDQTVKIWDVNSGHLLRVLRPQLPVSRQAAEATDSTPDVGNYVEVAFTADGAQILAIDRNGTAQTWDARSGVPLGGFTIPGGSDLRRFGVATRTSRLAHGLATDRVMHVWDASVGAETASLKGSRDVVLLSALSADGRWAAGATGPEDQPVCLRVWNVDSGQEVRHIVGPETLAEVLAISPDGRLLVAIGADEPKVTDRALRVWDVGSGQLLYESPHLDVQPKAVAISSDGHFALATGASGVLQLWRLPRP